MHRLFFLTGLIFISLGTVWGQSDIADTPWGHPSLEGLWSNETLTPFERPHDQADREYITQEEASAAAARKAAAIALDAAPRKSKAVPPKQGGNVGGYNLGWLDNGTTVVSTMRSSQIVEPSNGQVPVRQGVLEQRDDDYLKSFEDPEVMSVWDRCITRGIPGKILFFLPETFTLILGIWGAVDSPRVENRRTLRFSFAFSES